MIGEHDLVVLKEDIVADRLRAGDVGTVVHVYPDGLAYEVEFTTLTGDTVAVATVEVGLVGRASPSDVHHTRPLAAAG